MNGSSKESPQALQILMKTLEEKDYSKAIILCNIILERYPRNELVKEIKKYVELQIGQPDDDVPISANELEEAESFNAFEAEEYSEEESEEEEEEEIEEETEEEENQQTKYSPKQKHEGNERNQMTTQRKAQTKMLRSRPTVVKPKTTTVKVSLQNFPKSKR